MQQRTEMEETHRPQQCLISRQRGDAAHKPRHAGSLTLPKQPHAAGSCLGQTEQDGRDV